jgi:hypothetical protein
MWWDSLASAGLISCIPLLCCCFSCSRQRHRLFLLFLFRESCLPSTPAIQWLSHSDRTLSLVFIAPVVSGTPLPVWEFCHSSCWQFLLLVLTYGCCDRFFWSGTPAIDAQCHFPVFCGHRCRFSLRSCGYCPLLVCLFLRLSPVVLLPISSLMSSLTPPCP